MPKAIMRKLNHQTCFLIIYPIPSHFTKHSSFGETGYLVISDTGRCTRRKLIVLSRIGVIHESVVMLLLSLSERLRLTLGLSAGHGLLVGEVTARSVAQARGVTHHTSVLG